jgi:CheY-like chemotaxis protein
MVGPVMIVDASPGRRRVADLLVDAGFSVIKAGSGRAAVDYLTSGKELPSLMVLDVELPDLDGWQLIQILRSYLRLSSVPVLIVSGAAIDPRLSTAYQVSEIFQKPVFEPVLLHRVRELTGVHQPAPASPGVAVSVH